MRIFHLIIIALLASVPFGNFCTAQVFMPTPDHIVIVIMENYGYNQVISQSAAPYINSLIGKPHTAFITNAYGVEHPSQPNYIDLFSCANQGVTDDNSHAAFGGGTPFSTSNLGAELFKKGLSYASYAEGLPSAGSTTFTSGKYYGKHNPGVNWQGTGTNRIPASSNLQFSSFPSTAAGFAALPTISFVIPDIDDDMHDPGVATGDNWLKNNTALQNYITWCKTNNSLFVLMWDENLFDGSGAGSNHVPLFFIGADVTSGTFVEPSAVNHFNILRTFQVMYGLTAPCANTVNYIQDIWYNPLGINTQGSGSVQQTLSVSDDITVVPNPFDHHTLISFKFDSNEDQEAPVYIEIFDVQGHKVFSGDQLPIFQTSGIAQLIVTAEDLNYKAGLYFLRTVAGNKLIVSRLFVQTK